METKRIRGPKRLSHASAYERRAARAGNAPPEHGQARRPNAKPAPSGKGGAGLQGSQAFRRRIGRMTKRTEYLALRSDMDRARPSRQGDPSGSATLDDRNREAGAARQRWSKDIEVGSWSFGIAPAPVTAHRAVGRTMSGTRSPLPLPARVEHAADGRRAHVPVAGAQPKVRRHGGWRKRRPPFPWMRIGIVQACLTPRWMQLRGCSWSRLRAFP
jgi:hypothetical protein